MWVIFAVDIACCPRKRFKNPFFGNLRNSYTITPAEQIIKTLLFTVRAKGVTIKKITDRYE